MPETTERSRVEAASVRTFRPLPKEGVTPKWAVRGAKSGGAGWAKATASGFHGCSASWRPTWTKRASPNCIGVAAIGEGLAGDAIGEGAGGGILREGGDHLVIEERHVPGEPVEGVPEGGGGPSDVLDEAIGAALEGLGHVKADELITRALLGGVEESAEGGEREAELGEGLGVGRQLELLDEGARVLAASPQRGEERAHELGPHGGGGGVLRLGSWLRQARARG